MLLLQQMIVLFVLMLIGFFVSKKGYISDATFKQMSWLVVYVACPAMVISGSVNSGKMMEGQELFAAMGLTLAIYAVLILLGLITPFILGIPKEDRGVYKVMMIFSNIGFMGFPLIGSLYGAEALLYAALFQIPFNVLIYTYGILVLKKKTDDNEKLDLKKIFNIGVICCIISIVIALFQIETPDFVKTIVSNLSNLTAPLSMMVIGASLTKIRFKDLFTDIRLLLFCGLKLIVIPVVMLFVLKQFINNTMVLGVCMVILSTPVASMTAMLAQQHDGNYPLASKGVAVSTILSVLTMPLVAMITGL